MVNISNGSEVLKLNQASLSLGSLNERFNFCPSIGLKATLSIILVESHLGQFFMVGFVVLKNISTWSLASGE